eukprot:4769814-Pleurochrysis_carterae.AAC.3
MASNEEIIEVWAKKIKYPSRRMHPRSMRCHVPMPCGMQHRSPPPLKRLSDAFCGFASDRRCGSLAIAATAVDTSRRGRACGQERHGCLLAWSRLNARARS